MEFVKESPYAKLARDALEYYLKTSKKMGLPTEFNASTQKTAVYVSIKKHGENRGCRGNFAAKQNIGQEIICNAINAGIYDSRFWPVKLEEFPELTFSVDVLSKPELVEINELDPHEYGVIIHSGNKHAVLLPALPGIDTINKQMETVKEKAKINNSEPCEIYRFITIRHLEDQFDGKFNS